MIQTELTQFMPRPRGVTPLGTPAGYQGSNPDVALTYKDEVMDYLRLLREAQIKEKERNKRVK